MADLIEPDYDVAGGIQAGDVGALVSIDHEATFVRYRGASFNGKLGPDIGTQRGIQAVKA